MDSLPAQNKEVMIYCIMALSNLILKLSINMAKISIVILSDFLTPPHFNCFILSLIFEKYLEVQLFRSKEPHRPPEERNSLIKQFPKVTVIKVAKKLNPFDSLLIEKCQNLFGSEASNLQLI